MSELPQGWSEAKLDDLLEYVTSGSRDWSKYYAEEGALFVRTQDINKNRLNGFNSIAKVNLPEKVEGKRTLIKRDDILLTITGANVGKCAHIEREIPEAYVSQSVALVRLAEKSLAKFVQRQLISPNNGSVQTKLEASAYGMGRPVLNLDNVREVSLNIAPHAEQARITQKLDELLIQVNTLKARIDSIPILLKRFRQSVLASAVSGKLTEGWRIQKVSGASEVNPASAEAAENFAWPIVRLGDAARDFSYGSSTKSQKAGDVPVLRMGNIQRNRLNWDDLVYSSDQDEIEKYLLQPGDVLFNRTNSPELVGKTAIYKGERKAIYAGYLIRIRCSENLNPDFLNYCLSSPQGRDYCWQVKTDGVSQSNINAKKLADFRFGLPSIQEQTEVVRRVEQLFAFGDQLESKVRTAKARIDLLSQSILAKAFRGELVPQDPNDEPASVLLERIRAQRAALPKTRRGRKSAATN